MSCISIKNQECRLKPQIVNVNGDNPIFFSFSIKTSKCSASCNSIENPLAKLFVPDVAENLNVKVFNLISRTNETRHIEWHETCKYEWRLNANVRNNKQLWNDDNSSCECKELIDKGVCNKVFLWNPSNCECQCDKSCNFGEYLDYENCKCRKKLDNKLVEECPENVDEVKIAGMALFEYGKEYVVLVVIVLTISIVYFVYFRWYLKRDVTGDKELSVKESFNYQSTI